MIRRGLVIVCLCAFLPGATGCFGSFELTRKVYGFNQRIDQDKWIQWLAFIALNFVPVYGAATFVDVIFANSVEFWTGQNPIAGPVTRTEYGPNGEVAQATFLPGRICDLEITDASGERHVLRLVGHDGGISVYDAAGQKLGTVTDRDGVPALVAAL